MSGKRRTPSLHEHTFTSLVTSSSVHRAESVFEALGFWAERDFPPRKLKTRKHVWEKPQTLHTRECS